MLRVYVITVPSAPSLRPTQRRLYSQSVFGVLAGMRLAPAYTPDLTINNLNPESQMESNQPACLLHSGVSAGTVVV